MRNTPASVIGLGTARSILKTSGPTTKPPLPRSINVLALPTATSGFSSSSWMITVVGRPPSLPPACLTPRLKPSRSCPPSTACGPDSTAITPILSSLASAPRTSLTANAASAASHCRVGMIPTPFVAVPVCIGPHEPLFSQQKGASHPPINIRGPDRSRQSGLCRGPAQGAGVPRQAAVLRRRFGGCAQSASASPAREETLPMLASLPILLYSDVICPWCYVGKRRLERALALPGMPEQIRLTWRPFELNPTLPAEGIERKAYRARKFGEARSAELDARMVETGHELGIDFAFERIARTPNTRLAHRLIWEAERQGRQDALVERLFFAYFQEGLDIGARALLQRLAAEAELAAEGVEEALTDGASLAAVRALEEQGQRLGIQGVPFFLLP